MAASASVIELKNRRVRQAAQQLRAAVVCVATCVQEAEGPELDELLVQIREIGVDPLEAAFAKGVRRFDRSGEYAVDGALSVTAWLALENLALLCRPHHRMVHEGGWSIKRQAHGWAVAGPRLVSKPAVLRE